MSSLDEGNLPYVSPAEPVVIGSAVAAENGPFQPTGFDGGTFPNEYNSVT